MEGTPMEPEWSSYVEPPLEIADPGAYAWDDAADVVVAGFGGAGACAALEARAQSADVLALDRFEGGGATALSGGIYYGGATRFLRAAGYDDTPGEMYAYLKREIGDVVRDETLQRFCEDSSANLEWMIGHGVRFGAVAYEGKRSYPPKGYDLYYSGNELVAGYVESARPAPRGHRAVGPNFTGGVLYSALRDSALRAGVRLRAQTRVTRLLLDRERRVVGVEARMFEPGSTAAREHLRLIRKVNAWQRYFEDSALKTGERIDAIEREAGRPLRIRARRGVVLATGSFAYNRAMVRDYAPKFRAAMPLGTLGCDGSGIRLGQTAGGALGRMDSVSAWRSISPPTAFVKGVVVDAQGRRFVSEDSYLGRLGHHIAEFHGGSAWAVIDSRLHREAWRDTIPAPGTSWKDFGLPLLINLLSNCRKGRTLGELAQRCGIDAQGLEASVAGYNAGVAAGADPLRKSARYLSALDRAPYYAIDLSLGNKRFPCPSIPMGGLVVDEDSGLVRRADGSRIAGLYAAGRAAVGIPSGFYVSGSSIADCVFSGRRAGRHAAAQALQPIPAETA